MNPCVAALLMLTMLWYQSSSAQENNAAYVLLYHHVAQSTPASTSVTPEQFAGHMDYLAEHGYRVVALQTIMQALADGKPIQPKSVAITFDDGYRSVFDNALPVLEQRGWPFTVFVSTDAIDRQGRMYLSWEQLRALEHKRGAIANHGRTHVVLVRRDAEESVQDWQNRASEDISYAQQRLDAELRAPSRLLAYPYGEFDAELADLSRSLGYLAVGQQSGPIGAGTHPQAAPRFPISTAYADLDRFAEKLRTRPLPVRLPEVPATVLGPDVSSPELSLTINPGPFRLRQMACYVSGQSPARLVWKSPPSKGEDTVALVQALEPLKAGRSRYTCTAPHSSQQGVYYWYTHLWMKPRGDGSWYEG